MGNNRVLRKEVVESDDANRVGRVFWLASAIRRGRRMVTEIMIFLINK